MDHRLVNINIVWPLNIYVQHFIIIIIFFYKLMKTNTNMAQFAISQINLIIIFIFFISFFTSNQSELLIMGTFPFYLSSRGYHSNNNSSKYTIVYYNM